MVENKLPRSSWVVYLLQGKPPLIGLWSPPTQKHEEIILNNCIWPSWNSSGKPPNTRTSAIFELIGAVGPRLTRKIQTLLGPICTPAPIQIFFLHKLITVYMCQTSSVPFVEFLLFWGRPVIVVYISGYSHHICRKQVRWSSGCGKKHNLHEYTDKHVCMDLNCMKQLVGFLPFKK